MTMVRYLVLHETRYDYGSPVSLSQQQVHLAPRQFDWQQLESQRIDIEPTPSWQRDAQDAFGNPVSWLSFDIPHQQSGVAFGIAGQRASACAQSARDGEIIALGTGACAACLSRQSPRRK